MAENGASDVWARLLRQLRDDKIDFVVIGGAALALHGLPRTTLDVDIVVSALALDDLFRALQDRLALATDQAAIRGLAATPDLAIGQCLSFHAPGGADVLDVFLESAAVMCELLADAETVQMSGVAVPVASLARLRAMKLAIARPIDLADVQMIDELTALLDVKSRPAGK